jgi:hypothetical protein
VVVLQGAKPAQVVVQIAGGNAMKAVELLLETAVIGIDVLDMDGAPAAHARAQVDGLVREVRVLRKEAVGRIAIAHQQRIFGQHRLQCAGQLGFGHFSPPRHPVQCSVCPVRSRATKTHTSSLDKLAVRALPPRRRAGRCNLQQPLAGLQKIRLIGLGDALQRSGAVCLEAAQEAVEVAPAQRSVAVNLQGSGCRAKWLDATKAALKPSHLSFLRNRASAVPVNALKVRCHVWQR